MSTVKDRGWPARRVMTAESLWQDICYGVCHLLKSPFFSVVAILSLALGIGANTAISTLINNLLLTSLPVRQPHQLASFGKASGGGKMDGMGPGPLDIFPYDFYKRPAQRQEGFQGICSFSSFHTMVSLRYGHVAVGCLFEGRVNYDKASAHASYGCAGCCASRGVRVTYNPFLVPMIFNAATNGVQSRDDCSYVWGDVRWNFDTWSTANRSIATTTALWGPHWRVFRRHDFIDIWLSNRHQWAKWLLRAPGKNKWAHKCKQANTGPAHLS